MSYPLPVDWMKLPLTPSMVADARKNVSKFKVNEEVTKIKRMFWDSAQEHDERVVTFRIHDYNRPGGISPSAYAMFESEMHRSGFGVSSSSASRDRDLFVTVRW